ncbi:hypothetical protein [Streptomyces angustmyceticus]|uniref:hypothetical protein n=1 Tax=Streptomyces angustmyceticus TaxID=285578 RepID=UPI003F54DCDE
MPTSLEVLGDGRATVKELGAIGFSGVEIDRLRRRLPLPGKKCLDCELAVPAGQGVDAVRPIREEIKPSIEVLIAEIDAQ